eukprot:5395578-Prymnesium_polylepis.1
MDGSSLARPRRHSTVVAVRVWALLSARRPLLCSTRSTWTSGLESSLRGWPARQRGRLAGSEQRHAGIFLISGYAPISTALDEEWDAYYDSREWRRSPVTW